MSVQNNTAITSFPSQKKSTSEKNEKWMKDCVEAAEQMTVFRDQRIRQSQYNKKINYDLYNDILDPKDMQRITNPSNIRNATFPAKMQNYPIANPKIDLLVGEELKRRFDWRVRVTNDAAISDKEAAIRDKILQTLTADLQAKSFNEEEAQKNLKRLNKYFNYEYQDMREQMATNILTYLYSEQNLKKKFNEGFIDGLVAGEEIYCCDIINGEPVLRRVNPLNLFNIRSGDSHDIDDSDLIIEYGYVPVGHVIDSYYDELTDDQIKDIEEGNVASDLNGVLRHHSMNPIFDITEFTEQNGDHELIEVNSKANRYFGGAYDGEGNIRVTRVVWKSLRKVGKLKYYDKDGDEQLTFVDENYKVNKAAGEEIEWKWINEWWEGTKIGADIFVKMQPRPIQFRNMTNISKCSSGYTGTFYATNDSKAKSLMDRMKPYQYLYNVFMYRTELAFAKSKGKIAELDISKIPDGWELDKWMYYAEILGWAPVDNFKEGKKGAAKGKLRGNMTGAAGSTVLDLEIGAYIQQHIMMLQYLEQQMGEISGVSKQRQGQVDQRELVGNVEHAVTQSSHITERWFGIHEHTKLKAMSTLLETAKAAWKNSKSKKLQYITDELQTVMFEVNGEIFNEAEYGLFISNVSADQELRASLKQLAHAGIQNDKLTWSALMDIYYSDSVSSIRRKIEAQEEEKKKREDEQIKQQQEHEKQLAQNAQAAQEKALERATADREDKQAHEKELKIMDIDAKLEAELIKQRGNSADRDANNNGKADYIDLQKIQQNANKIQKDYEINKRQLDLKEREVKTKEKKAAKPTPKTSK